MNLSGESKTIDGVTVQPLNQICDQRGKVMHMLRCDSSVFKQFGEVYFSKVNQYSVKAWKRHRRMTQHLAVPVGKIQLVVYDDRDDSPSKGTVQVLELGEENYNLVRIPPFLWYGFKGLSKNSSLIANCTDLPHDPSEIERCIPEDGIIPYNW